MNEHTTKIPEENTMIIRLALTILILTTLIGIYLELIDTAEAVIGDALHTSIETHPTIECRTDSRFIEHCNDPTGTDERLKAIFSALRLQ